MGKTMIKAVVGIIILLLFIAVGSLYLFLPHETHIRLGIDMGLEHHWHITIGITIILIGIILALLTWLTTLLKRVKK